MLVLFKIKNKKYTTVVECKKKSVNSLIHFVHLFNGALINITCFLMGGFIPALFLRIKQQYLISTMCILVFFIVGFVLKNSINIYENFYGLSQYLG